MRKSFVASALLFFVLSFTQSAHAVTVYYQPTPYPASTVATIPESSTHFLEGWVAVDGNSIPVQQNGTTLQQGNWLYVGGWSANYRYLTYLKFNLTGLPMQVDSALFWLLPGSVSSPWTLTPYGVCPVLSPWNAISSWATLPSVGQCADWYSAPVPGYWAGFWASGSWNWYNQWRSGALVNNGVMIHSQNFNYSLDQFVSSQYPPSYDGARPILQLDFTPTLQLKMPLPGNHTWLVTTEVGGWDCKGNWYDSAHDNNNYFSIDFSWKNVADSGATIYPDPDPNLNRQNNGVYIPVIAAAGGKVVKATYTSDNGYYVVINHSGGTTESTGFTTRYLHLQPPGPTVTEGQTVQQGDIIGYVGNTGTSNGAHLHFGVRYNNSGYSTVPETTKVVMDGWLLKSFQTECAVNGSGVPTNFIRYYRSNNRIY